MDPAYILNLVMLKYLSKEVRDLRPFPPKANPPLYIGFDKNQIFKYNSSNYEF